MRMKKFCRFFMSMLAVCSIAACSDDELGNKPVVDPGASTDAVYMNVTVQLPTGPGTRSETGEPDDGYGTSSDGIEVGHKYENKVKQVLLVLARYDVNEETKVSGANDNKFIGYSYSGDNQSSILNFTENGTEGKITQAISKAVLSKYYKDNAKDIGDGNYEFEDGKNKVRVYVFCNPTSRLIQYFRGGESKDDWINKTASIEEKPGDEGVTVGNETDGAAIWGGEGHDEGFLMTTAKGEETVKKIPLRLKTWNEYDKPSGAFDFSGTNGTSSNGTVINNTGSIAVERAVARFDFKDGSGNTAAANTYNVVTDNDGKTIIQIELQRMALVNMSKNFYYLRRVSNDGLKKSSSNEFELCGPEKRDNYVVDTDADAKKGAMSSFVFGDHFNFCLGTGATGDETWKIDETTRSSWYSTKISDVLNNKDLENQDRKEYHIWRYVTENTIPKATTDGLLQRNGISTGVVFRGKMKAIGDAVDTDLGRAINNAKGVSDEDPILYKYDNDLYCTWKEVRKIAIAKKNESGGQIFYEMVFGSPKNNPQAEKKDEGSEKIEAVYSDDKESPDYWWGCWKGEQKKEEGDARDPKEEFRSRAKKAQFTIYQSNIEDGEAGYFCYYFYWNRHNNNNNDYEMGPMEFAVVRNNVYKLAVTAIRKLGHPRITENDPDPVDPEDPDEKGDVYISVSVEVLPWVVRVNNIEF